MKIMVKVGAIMGLGGMLCGCTVLKAVKADATRPQGDGLPYAMPKIFLQVTPKPDHTVTVEPIYLPDADKTFLMSATSYLSNHKFALSRKDGLPTKVEFNPSSTAIAETAIGIGQVAGTELLKARTEAKKAEDAALGAAQKAVDDAQAEMNLAKIKLDTLLQRNADADDINDALVAYEQAVFKWKRAKAALGRLLGVATKDVAQALATPVLHGHFAANEIESATVEAKPLHETVVALLADGVDVPDNDKAGTKPPVKSDDKTVATKLYPGPMLYALNEEWKGDKLVSTLTIVKMSKDAQTKWVTNQLVPNKIEPSFFPTGIISVAPDKARQYRTIQVSTEAQLISVDPECEAYKPPFASKDASSGVKDEKNRVTASLTNKLTIEFHFPADMGPKGDATSAEYKVVYKFKYKDQNDNLITSDPFELHVKLVK